MYVYVPSSHATHSPSPPNAIGPPKKITRTHSSLLSLFPPSHRSTLIAVLLFVPPQSPRPFFFPFPCAIHNPSFPHHHQNKIMVRFFFKWGKEEGGDDEGFLCVGEPNNPPFHVLFDFGIRCAFASELSGRHTPACGFWCLFCLGLGDGWMDEREVYVMIPSTRKHPKDQHIHRLPP